METIDIAADCPLVVKDDLLLDIEQLSDEELAQIGGGQGSFVL